MKIESSLEIFCIWRPYFLLTIISSSFHSLIVCYLFRNLLLSYTDNFKKQYRTKKSNNSDLIFHPQRNSNTHFETEMDNNLSQFITPSCQSSIFWHILYLCFSQCIISFEDFDSVYIEHFKAKHDAGFAIFWPHCKVILKHKRSYFCSIYTVEWLVYKIYFQFSTKTFLIIVI